MTYWILLMFVLPVIIAVLFISAIVTAILDKARYAGALLLSCILIPASFLGGLQSMRMLGLARYETSGLNEMRSLDEEPNGNIIVVYDKASSFNDREYFFNHVINPWEEEVGFSGATGVGGSRGLGEIDGRTVEKIIFRASATEAQKEKLRMGLQASQLIYRYYENLTEKDVKAKLGVREQKQ